MEKTAPSPHVTPQREALAYKKIIEHHHEWQRSIPGRFERLLPYLVALSMIPLLPWISSLALKAYGIELTFWAHWGTWFVATLILTALISFTQPSSAPKVKALSALPYLAADELTHFLNSNEKSQLQLAQNYMRSFKYLWESLYFSRGKLIFEPADQAHILKDFVYTASIPIWNFRSIEDFKKIPWLSVESPVDTAFRTLNKVSHDLTASILAGTATEAHTVALKLVAEFCFKLRPGFAGEPIGIDINATLEHLAIALGQTAAPTRQQSVPKKKFKEVIASIFSTVTVATFGSKYRIVRFICWFAATALAVLTLVPVFFTRWLGANPQEHAVELFVFIVTAAGGLALHLSATPQPGGAAPSPKNE
jgi:hypothetical protein